MKNTKRNSNLELLRIICMILIIGHHLVVHSDFTVNSEITFNTILAQIFSLGGKIGTNIFVIITGYFMINSQFKVKKLLKLIFEVFTYSTIILGITKIFAITDIDLELQIKSILPTIYSLYWFPTTYIIVYILSPYINKIINLFDKKTLKKMILTLLIIQCVIPTFTGTNFAFNRISWFITLYIMGAYIRKNEDEFKNRNYKKICFVTFIILILSVVVINLIGTKIKVALDYTTYFADMNMIPAVIISFALFFIFKNIKIKDSVIINSIASTTFGIYLIHDNEIIRNILWKDIFNINNYITSNYFVIYCIIAVSIVFIVCMFIDYIRKGTIEKLFIYIYDKVEMPIINIYRKNLQKLKKNEES